MNFDDYIQQLLGNTNPQGNMFTGLSSMPPSNNTLQTNTGNPFNIQNAIDARNAAEAQNAANQRAGALDAMGMENARGMFESQVLNSGGGEGGGGGNSGQGPLGVGKATDAINEEAFQAFVMGYLTGGLPGAVKGGLQSLAKGTAGFLSNVNSTDDPLGAWAIAQGHAPVPVTNMDTLFGGGIQAPPAAVTSPVNMSLPPTTPIAPAFNDSSNAAATAQAQANAAANAAAVAAAQSSGSASSGLGGDLGTGASDAAGFGGFGGVW